MSDTDLVRASRDGDQFHYWWAARRALGLIDQNQELKLLTIEGASNAESKQLKSNKKADEIIDVAEYFGGETFETANKILYSQLKHSTVRTSENWKASELAPTLSKFFRKYQDVAKALGNTEANKILRFSFVTNRPISARVTELFDSENTKTKIYQKQAFKTFKKHINIPNTELLEFLNLITFSGNNPDFIGQRERLSSDLHNFLADRDSDAPVQLKELVTRKATNDNNNNGIMREDMLRVLGVELDELFPAPNQVEVIRQPIKRLQQIDVQRQIEAQSSKPIVIHGVGGLGKSILARNLLTSLPAESTAILYDCFGNGSYRNISQLRHRHKDGLVQIANEMASKKLCFPLIPAKNADPKSYMRAFLARLKSASDTVEKESGGQIWLIIDAADNAQQAAEDEKIGNSFARDLARENLPDNVRLVLLCRSHRIDLLAPPIGSLLIELEPFQLSETTQKLCEKFPDASDDDAKEFHRLSSQNPRVQATVLSQDLTLNETLKTLGPEPTQVEDQIQNLLNQSLQILRDQAHSPEDEQIDLICAGLSILRPMVPILVLSYISGLNASAIRSFVSDLGSPLIVKGDAIQFKDEPTETWFREQFSPTSNQLKTFAKKLREFSQTSSYAAAALPQVMLNAGQLSELIELTLAGDALPKDSPIDKRDIELQRYEFALRASLREEQLTEAAKLAYKAGIETAADDRQIKIIQSNTDLVARFLDPHQAQELIARRLFGSSWMGAHHAYEATLLSSWEDFHGDARSHLRMANDWIRNWSKLGKEDRRNQSIEAEDVAEMVLAHLNIHGPSRAAREVRRWTPREISYRIGKIVSSRLIDHCRFEDLDCFAISARNDIGLLLAINQELRAVGRSLQAPAAARLIRFLLSTRITLEELRGDYNETSLISALVAVVQTAVKLKLANDSELAGLLGRYIPDVPPYGIASEHGGQRHDLMRAYTLRAVLKGEQIALDDLKHSGLRKKEGDDKQRIDNARLNEFEYEVGSLLPWHLLWSKIATRRIKKSEFAGALDEAISQSNQKLSRVYREWSRVPSEISGLWFECIRDSGADFSAAYKKFSDWSGRTNFSTFTPALTQRARVLARTKGTGSFAIEFAHQAHALLETDKLHAESKSGEYAALARALLPVSQEDSRSYFNKAIEISSNIGDENVDRWEAVVSVAEKAEDIENPDPELSYKYSQCAELTYEYIARDKHFCWEETVESLVGLCPSSSLAILSRWRDRHFGYAPRLLDACIKKLRNLELLGIEEESCLVGFRYLWGGSEKRDYCSIIESVIFSSMPKEQQREIVQKITRYARISGLTSENLSKISQLNEQIGLPKLFSEAEWKSCVEQERQQKDKNIHSSSIKNKIKDEEKLWDGVFSETTFTDSESVAKAYQKAIEIDGLYAFTEKFFGEAIARIPAGSEASFLRGIKQISQFELYHIRALLEVYPENWKKRLSTKAAISEVIEEIIKRHCIEISANRFYQKLPLSLTSVVTGIEQSSLIDIALSAIGVSEYLGGYVRLFNITSLIAQRLSPSEARDVLNFIYGTYEDLGVKEEGDGVWSKNLLPIPDVTASLAGYIWGALANPSSHIRWEAAHCVRLGTEFKCDQLLSEIIAIDEKERYRPYIDQNLFCYKLHAKQWLVIALARAAFEAPEMVAQHRNYLKNLTTPGQTHAIIRHFAAKGLLAIGDAQPDEIQHLKAINSTNLPVIEPDDGSPSKARKIRRSEDSFSFNLDMDQYWFQPLARCFGKSPGDVETVAETIIREEWGLEENGYWNSDERAKRGYFRDREAYHSHGSYPKHDSVSFYLSYHSMMETAGRWIDSIPLVREQYSDSDPEPFSAWLDRHLLSVDERCWLADLRDPIPIEWIDWDEEKRAEWRWSVTKADLMDLLGQEDGWVTISGSWTNYFGSREQSVNITSALISARSAKAFLNAAQTANDRFGICMPNDYDDSVIDRNKFQLKNFLRYQHTSSGIDEYDPWSGGISNGFNFPDQDICDLLGIMPDEVVKNWFANGRLDDAQLFRRSVWGTFVDEGDDGYVERGSKTQIKQNTIPKLEKLTGLRIILKVTCERNFDKGKHSIEYSDGENIQYAEPYSYFCLINEDGSYEGYA